MSVDVFSFTVRCLCASRDEAVQLDKEAVEAFSPDQVCFFRTSDVTDALSATDVAVFATLGVIVKRFTICAYCDALKHDQSLVCLLSAVKLKFACTTDSYCKSR